MIVCIFLELKLVNKKDMYYWRNFIFLFRIIFFFGVYGGGLVLIVWIIIIVEILEGLMEVFGDV